MYRVKATARTSDRVPFRTSVAAEYYQKKHVWEDTKRAVFETLDQSWIRFPDPGLDVKTNLRNMPCSFTDSDLDELKAVMEDKKAKQKANYIRQQEHLEEEKRRWEALKQKWVCNESKVKEQGGDLKRYRGESEEKPGIFRVSQDLNSDYDTFHSFVGAFKTEGEARSCHPMGGDACEYKQSELDRNESWCESLFFGPAPGWYLGRHDTWVHGSYVKVERLSDYVPPEGKEPKYGIWNTSFNAG